MWLGQVREHPYSDQEVNKIVDAMVAVFGVDSSLSRLKESLQFVLNWERKGLRAEKPIVIECFQRAIANLEKRKATGNCYIEWF